MERHPQISRPPTSQDVNPTRHTVLGEMHRGKVRIDETHPFLKKMVRLSMFGNVLCLFLLWLSLRIKSLIPPHDAPIMTAIGWYFFFGAMYGVFAQSLFSFARFTEVEAVIKQMTPNRRYEFHSHYDTAGMTEADLKKPVGPAEKNPHTGRHERSAAVGAGGKSYFYAGMFVLWALGCAAWGIESFFATLLP